MRLCVVNAAKTGARYARPAPKAQSSCVLLYGDTMNPDTRAALQETNNLRY
ncbi:MAG: hypothetical protein Cons2KO_34260 [Congregibacter sp.]